MNYFRRQSNNTTCILLIKVYTQSNKSIPLINKAAVIQSNTTNEVTLKSLLRSEISSAQQSQSSQSEGTNKNKRRTISITNNSVEIQTIEGTNINALLDLPICNLFDVLNKQQQQRQGSNSGNKSSSYEIIVIVKGHDDIDDTNETTTRRRNSSSTTSRKQNNSPRIVRILIILALLAIISEIFVPNTTISSTSSDSDASFATPTATNQQHYKYSQTNHIPTSTNNNPNVNRNTNANKSNSGLGNKRQVQIEQCTPSELSLILYQLPNEDCYTYKKQPWRQKCSLTYATKCPDATWLERYYAKLHHNTANQTSTSKSQQQTFLAIFIGCNKGYDAINTLRMGSGNPIFDKDKWKDALTNHGMVQIKNDVCNQASEPQFVLPPGNSVQGGDGDGIRSQVHCIEPLPPTIRELQRAANETNYGKQGLVVVHAAMAREDGVVPFDSGLRNKAGAGVENIGISNSNCDDPDNQCVNVTMYSLDTYINKFIPKDMPINYLSVDVEGWDYNVLMGGQQHALERVHYLEFEYNWIGPWKDQSLKDLIELLDTKFGFTCYFAGFDETIWRITGCWLDHYNVHTWSNVACVNRNYDEIYDIAYEMERMYKATIEKGNDGLRDFEHRKQVAVNPNV